MLGILGLLAAAMSANGGGRSASDSRPTQPTANAPTVKSPAATRRAAARRAVLKRIISRSVAQDSSARPAAKTAAAKKPLTLRQAAAARQLSVTPVNAAARNNAAARAAADAAAKAALAQALRQTETSISPATAPRPRALPKAPSSAPRPTPPPATIERTPKRAAQDLRAWLLKTKRFGTKSDRPPAVISAQQDMGLKADGIVGPQTRKAARLWGVVLPPR